MYTEPLRVAVVAPPWFDVPPRGYGGIEAVLADLVDALIERGNDVTLIGAGTDLTKAQFIQTFDTPPSERLGEPFPEVVHAARVAKILQTLDVDVVHDHSLAGPLLAFGGEVPTVVTVHGPVDSDLRDYYGSFGRALSLVAISNQQRRNAPELNWRGTVHNALHVQDFQYQADKEDWILFLGRSTADKGMHIAIDAARAAGRRIVLAAKCIEPAEKDYFRTEIEPRLGPDTEWLGEVGVDQKKDLLARARCLLFPIQWDEPFGMVMIEALASGTPVVATRRGSVPEVVVDGVTGLVCDDVAELPWALDEVERIEPELCRKDVDDRFSPHVMAAGYERVFRSVIRPVRGRTVPKLGVA
ncbi:MAG: glycosyltransferase family 4 protein [Jiangellaceae bacterium]|nr:glycosyltransferase family 4 protein [Jiangellaceae bacterium]